MLKRIVERLPKSYKRYYEPFIGGGAVLLSLAPDDAVIGDANSFLLNLWNRVANDVDSVIFESKKLDRLPYTRETFSKIRDMFNMTLSAKEYTAFSAALFLWMTKRSFGGVMRFNKSGKCNSTFRLVPNSLLDESNPRRISDYLRNHVVISAPGDFSQTCYDVGKDDFVFLDPPYTECSHNYNGERWREDDHERLASFCRDLDKKGAYFMTTYNDSSFLRDLYRGFYVDDVPSQWCITGNKRISELIITNYEPKTFRLF